MKIIITGILNDDTTKSIEVDKNVKILNLGSINLRTLDTTPLQNLTNLEYLNLHNIQLKTNNLSFLQNLINLEYLNLSYTMLRTVELTPLQNLTNLETLDLFNNKLKTLELTPLQNLTKLRKLDICYNLLEYLDLTPLQNLTNLETLDLGFNRLKTLDLAPLRYCKNLKNFSVESENPPTFEWNAQWVDFSLLPPDLQKHTIEFRQFWEKQKKEEENREKSEENIIKIAKKTKSISLDDLSKTLGFSDSDSCRNWLLFEVSESIAFELDGDIIVFEPKEDTQEVLGTYSSTQEKKKKLLCMYCQGQLEEIKDEELFVCLDCGKNAPYCEVCKNIIVEGEEIAQTKLCNHIFHKNHILEWIKVKGECPTCKIQINSQSLQKFYPNVQELTQYQDTRNIINELLSASFINEKRTLRMYSLFEEFTEKIEKKVIEKEDVSGYYYGEEVTKLLENILESSVEQREDLNQIQRTTENIWVAVAALRDIHKWEELPLIVKIAHSDNKLRNVVNIWFGCANCKEKLESYVKDTELKQWVRVTRDIASLGKSVTYAVISKSAPKDLLSKFKKIWDDWTSPDELPEVTVEQIYLDPEATENIRKLFLSEPKLLKQLQMDPVKGWICKNCA
ncbi:MAG: Internalin-A precursor [Candidatus Heimdallarchaeota archaeon AB_125]|nr:MAG: Internalin-A precursor [Candidatus Heimdallarchaeota archaeon AB_125]